MGCGNFKRRTVEDLWKFQRINEYKDNYGERKVVRIV
jgi:hypothetical protein